MKSIGRAAIPRSLLRGIDIFSSLSEAELAALASKMKRRSYAPGELIFREGESGEELFALASGLVAVTVRSGPAPGGASGSASGGAGGVSDEEIELSRLGGGSFFGEMAILERAPRSASCRALEASDCLVLEAADFDALLSETPSAAAGVLERMLAIAAARLVKTGSFLSQMVQWGEAARRRAITDSATGLFNRRYLEDNFESFVASAAVPLAGPGAGAGLSFAMFDLDRFGSLNASYGFEFCDRVIVRIAQAFRLVFGEEDALVRYGGDEFCFIIRRPPAEALRLCEAVCSELRGLSFEEHPELGLSCSIGLAHFPEAGRDASSLKDRADKALYLAKEGGRDRVAVWRAAEAPEPRGRAPEGPKLDIPSIAAKDRVERRIAAELERREAFLIVGHRDPDEDCIASMVAFALLASKFGKKAAIVLGAAVPANYAYLKNICLYNSIEVERSAAEVEAFASEAAAVPSAAGSGLGLVLVDTPKPEMIDRPELYEGLASDPSVVKIEIDHHLETDSAYFGDPEYRLVYEASSSCEIIGRLVLKLARDGELLARYQIGELVTRNLALAILSGMVSDSQLGRYLKSERVRRSYSRLSSDFERILRRTTRSGSGNFSNKEELFSALAALSRDEDACFAFMAADARTVGALRLAVLGEEASAKLFATYGNETVVSVSKALVDKLAESSGKLGLVGYYDDPSLSSFVQFRLRRSQLFDAIDLREALGRLGVENGGGHPGAIGMRIDRGAIGDIEALVERFARVLNGMIDETGRK